jgi:hypothetical protein
VKQGLDDLLMRPDGPATFRKLLAEARGSRNGEEKPPAEDSIFKRLKSGRGVTLREFLTLEFPAKTWLVPGLIERDALVVLAGPPGAGKTFLAYDCAVQTAKAGSTVLIYQLEGSAFAMQHRLSRAAKANGLTDQDLERILLYRTGSLVDDDGAEQIIAEAQEHGAQLVVLDKLARLSGDVEENSAKEWGAVANRLEKIRREGPEGCTVLPLHDLTKDTWDSKKIPQLRDMRGSGALAGASDVVYGFKKKSAESTADALVFDLYDLKQRDLPEGGPPRRVRIAMSGEAATIQIDLADTKADEAAKEKLRLENAVLGATPWESSGEWTSKQKIAKKLHRSEPAVARAVDHLVAMHQLRRKGYKLQRPGAPPTVSGYEKLN